MTITTRSAYMRYRHKVPGPEWKKFKACLKELAICKDSIRLIEEREAEIRIPLPAEAKLFIRDMLDRRYERKDIFRALRERGIVSGMAEQHEIAVVDRVMLERRKKEILERREEVRERAREIDLFARVPRCDENVVNVILCKSHAFQYTLRRNYRVVRLWISEVPGKLQKVPGMLKRIPEAIRKIPASIRKAPGILRKVPGMLKRVPELLKKVPERMKNFATELKGTFFRRNR